METCHLDNMQSCSKKSCDMKKACDVITSLGQDVKEKHFYLDHDFIIMQYMYLY